MNFHRFFLKTANSLVSLVVILFLTVAGVYSGYALWDNAQVYAAVDDVQSELLKLKPDAAEEDGASFEELLAVNPDVCAWLTLDNTGIDYPVVQGEDNLSYINTDVYGELPWPEAFFWIPAVTIPFTTSIPCSMDTTWKTAKCSAIWICMRMRSSLTRIPRVC